MESNKSEIKNDINYVWDVYLSTKNGITLTYYEYNPKWFGNSPKYLCKGEKISKLEMNFKKHKNLFKIVENNINKSLDDFANKIKP
jgi:hypothetical protein